MGKKTLSKKLMAILLTLISIAIIVIAFVGIYMQQLNKLKNIVPDATYSSEIDGAIEYRLSVDNTEEEAEVYVDDEGNIRGEVANGNSTSSEDWENNTGFTIESQIIRQNSDDVLNAENYEKTKEIIEKRLDSMGATDYAIRLDDNTGYMVVELSENDDINYLYETAVCTTGKIEVIDYQTGVVLIDDSHIVSASVYPYSQDGITYTIYLNIEFDEEGAQILNDISTEYIAYTNDNGESVTDYVSITMDGSSIYTTYFGEEYTDSAISVPLGSNISDEDTLNAYIESAQSIATIINLEELPVIYTQDNTGYLIQSNIDDMAAQAAQAEAEQKAAMEAAAAQQQQAVPPSTGDSQALPATAPVSSLPAGPLDKSLKLMSVALVLKILPEDRVEAILEKFAPQDVETIRNYMKVENLEAGLDMNYTLKCLESIKEFLPRRKTPSQESILRQLNRIFDKHPMEDIEKLFKSERPFLKRFISKAYEGDYYPIPVKVAQIVVQYVKDSV